MVPIPIKYRAAVSHTRLTFSIEIKTAGRSGVRIYEPRNDGERSCGKGGLLLPSAGSALCVEGNGSDKTGLRVRQRLWECWRLAYAPWSGCATHRAMGARSVIWRQSEKNSWHTALLPAIMVRCIAPNTPKALKGALKTLRAKPKSNAGRELPMEEENEYTGMTADEMQRFFDMEAEQGTSELEAYRKLMRILGIEFPSKE